MLRLLHHSLLRRATAVYSRHSGKQAAEDWMILWLSALFPLMHKRPWRLSRRLILVWAVCNTGIYSLQKSQQPEGTSSSQPVPSLFTHQLSAACLAAAFHPALLFLPVDLAPSLHMSLFALVPTDPSSVFHLPFLKFCHFCQFYFLFCFFATSHRARPSLWRNAQKNNLMESFGWVFKGWLRLPHLTLFLLTAMLLIFLIHKTILKSPWQFETHPVPLQWKASVSLLCKT